MDKYVVEWFVKPEHLQDVLNEKTNLGYKLVNLDTFKQNCDKGCYLYYSCVFEKEN